MRIVRPTKKGPEIPMCSMADIAFLLIIFFMVTTVFMVERGIQVTLPRAVSTKKLPKKNITHIWVSSEGAISIDDNIVKSDYVSPIMAIRATTNESFVLNGNISFKSIILPLISPAPLLIII